VPLLTRTIFQGNSRKYGVGDEPVVVSKEIEGRMV